MRNKRALIISAIGAVLNFALFGTKLWIGLALSSVSVLTDAINNLGDVASCILSIVCFSLIGKESQKLAFGYGRLEQAVELLMSVPIIFIGIYFLTSAIDRIFLADLVTTKVLYLIIMSGTVVVKVGMAWMYRYFAKKLHSAVLRTAYLDSIADAAITTMTIIGLALTKYVQLRIDAVFGIVVSCLMIAEGIKIAGRGIVDLLGRRMDKETEQSVRRICEKNPILKEITKIEYHDYGEGNKIIYIFSVFTNETEYAIIEEQTQVTEAEIKRELGLRAKFCVNSEVVK